MQRTHRRGHHRQRELTSPWTGAYRRVWLKGCSGTGCFAGRIPLGNNETTVDLGLLERLTAELMQARKDLQVPSPDPPQSYLGGMQRYRKAVEAIKAKGKRLGLE